MEMPTCTSTPTNALKERESLSRGVGWNWPALYNGKLAAVLTPSNLLLVTLLTALLWRPNGALPYHLLALTAVVAAVSELRKHMAGSAEAATAAGDIVLLVYAALLVWHLATSRFGLLDKMLFQCRNRC